jgi:hypothetical protein
MTDTVTKQDVLAAIDDERASWEALVAEIDSARMEDPNFAGGWSFKDIVAHITAWRMRSIERLEAAGRGEPAPVDPWPSNLQEDDEINEWFYARDQNLPLTDVLQTASNSYARLRTAIEAAPEEALNDPNWLPWMEGDALGPTFLDRSYFGHLHDEHEADIRAWIAATA